jgi:hypothetical protein
VLFSRGCDAILAEMRWIVALVCCVACGDNTRTGSMDRALAVDAALATHVQVTAAIDGL